MKKNWRPITTSMGKYVVSDNGDVARVLNDGTLRLLQPQSDGCGRQHVMLKRFPDGAFRSRRIHQLVLEAFVGPRPAGLVCCHNNGDARDNRLSNLRYDTQRNNVADAKRHGTFIKGERVGTSKLSEDEVAAVRVLVKAKWSNHRISRLFGVGVNAIWKIKKGESWAHAG